jgi:hypothetical protein
MEDHYSNNICTAIETEHLTSAVFAKYFDGSALSEVFYNPYLCE